MSHLNLQQLIAPISAEQPVGINCRDDISPESLYYSVKDARAQARNLERKLSQGDTDADPSKSWQTVYQDSQKLLSTQSKDLEVACWLTEALIRRDSFEGLLSGFNLIEQLIQHFWAQLHPMPDDEDGMETRLAPLFGLIGGEAEGSLIAQINLQPITQDNGAGTYALWQYRQSIDANGLQDEQAKQNRYKQGIAPLENVQQAANESGADFYQTLSAQITACREAYQRIDTLLTEHCPDTALPSTHFLTTAFESLEDHIRFITADAPFSVSNPESVGTSSDENHHTEDSTVAERNSSIDNTGNANSIYGQADSINQSIQSRAHAFEKLQRIANFFKQTEPHSPTAYLLEQAIRWGKMSLPDLLNELISDDNVKTQTYKLTGIPQQPT